MLTFVLAGIAQSEPITTGAAEGFGISVRVDDPVDPTAAPIYTQLGTTSNACQPATDTCPTEDSATVLAQAVSTTAVASAIDTEAEAKVTPRGAATLQDEMQAWVTAESGTVPLLSSWNVRGYSRVAGFSALEGAILADVIEAEAVAGTNASGATVKASGARVLNLVLAGQLATALLADIIPGEVNQQLLRPEDNAAGIGITYWETNWDPATNSTPDGGPVWVNTLHITGPGVDIIVARAVADSNYVAPAPIEEDPADPPVANEPPVATDDTGTTRIDSPTQVDVTANDSADALDSTVTITQGPANGAVTCEANVCTYVPNSGFVGEDTFEYQVCDDAGQCDTATVTITVTNAPPVADDDSASTTENASVTVAVTDNDSDPDGNLVPTSAAVTAQPANGVVICDNGSCTYTPEEGFVGTDTFEYRVCDTKNLCDTAVVTITVSAGVVAGTNQPPNAVDDSATTAQSTAVSVNVIGNDTDVDGTVEPTSVAVVSAPANGAVVCSNGTCTYTPEGGFSGTDSFVYRVCDDDLACATATVTITVAGEPVTGANRPPVAVDDSRSTAHNVAVTLNVVNNDSDPDDNLVPVATVTRQPSQGSVACSGGSCTYTPNPGSSGVDTFDYRVCDTDDACAEASVTITVGAAPGGGGPAPTNEAPVAEDDTSTTPAGSSVTIDVTPNDSDADNNLSETVTVIRHPANGAVICEQGQCTYTPEPGFSGTDSFDYRICDTSNLCDTATVTITVTPAPSNGTGDGNSAPIARDDSITTNGGTAVTFPVLPNDSDPDGNLDGTTVAITLPPAHGAVICSAGSCTYTPEPGHTGTDSFEYRVCDTMNACDTATVVIEVTGPPVDSNNQPPVARDDTRTGRPGASVTIGVIDNDSDPDGDLDPGSVTVTVPPANGSVICLQGKCTYTPDPGFSGNDSFDYRVCDLLGACTTATVTITVPSLNVGEGDGGPGDGGNGGSGPGNNNGNDGGDDSGEGTSGPGTDGDPALPGDTPPNAPISLDNPLLGAPNAPLPLTGGEPSFYLGAALNLLLLGMLLLLIERFTRASRLLKPCPASHNHEEPQARIGCSYGEWVKEPRMLLFLLERFGRTSRTAEACPEWHNHQEPQNSNGCAYGEWS